MYKKLLILNLIFFVSLFGVDKVIEPIPLEIKVDREKAILGKELFFDTTLSKDNGVSCATCHLIEEGGDDNMRFSFGFDGRIGKRNAPTIYNVVFNFRQFWDGRAKNLEKQALEPIEDPNEMANSFEELIPFLKKTPYKDKFKKIYKDGITKMNIANAIAEYEKTLITPNAPFDKYLRGDKKAISEKAKEGYQIFKTKGCILCHQGINIGGNMFSKIGIFADINKSDLGRYYITHRERDKGYFKVPSLRNITETAPYFHDGSIEELREAILIMANYQLGRKITKDEVDKILEFLKSLSGDIPKDIE